MMKLWQTQNQLDKTIEAFTVGRDRDLDLQLAAYDIQGSIAHIRMLQHVGLLEKEELEVLEKELKVIYQEVEEGAFSIAEGVEDVHSQVEWMLTERLGQVGKKIHSGRSRNDQVLVDLRLFFRAEIQDLSESCQELFDILLSQSERYQDVLMPGYTHMQVAMVSSFGMWFGAYAESLTEDMQQLQAVYRIVNQNPLGSAAGYGSSMPLNRRMTTDLLGFDDLCYNSLHAQMGRGKTELFLSFSMAALAQTLGKLAMDVCLFMSQNFGFVSLPDSLTTGSSIMPHKKNPDVFELIRARCNQLMALPQEIGMISNNLPSGYHRDYQIIKEVLFPALKHLKDCLQMTAFGIQQIGITEDLLKQEQYQQIYSVELVNREVLNGLPFRDAYQKVKTIIANDEFKFDGQIEHQHEGSIGQLCHKEIRSKMQRICKGFGFERVDLKISQLI